jgi:hypothetical protein
MNRKTTDLIKELFRFILKSVERRVLEDPECREALGSRPFTAAGSWRVMLSLISVNNTPSALAFAKSPNSHPRSERAATADEVYLRWGVSEDTTDLIKELFRFILKSVERRVLEDPECREALGRRRFCSDVHQGKTSFASSIHEG